MLLKTFVKHVHNRPFRANLTEAELRSYILMRNRHLTFLVGIGLPLTVISIKLIGLQYKDVITINTTLGEGGSTGIDNKNNIPILFLLNNLKNRIPDWVKLLFKLLFLVILVIKLLGFNVLDVIISTYYIKMYIIIGSSLVILYELINLYFLHRFYNKNIKISKILPEFIINWLKEFEILSSSNENFYYYKKFFYIHIFIFIIFIIIAILI